MITLKCIGRYKENGRIVGYQLADEHGNTRIVRSNKLKNAIARGEALVVNLTLTSDGRLIQRLESKPKTANDRNFVILDMYQIKGSEMLETILGAIEVSNLPVRVVRLGSHFYRGLIEAYFYLKSGTGSTKYMFAVRENRNGEYICTIPGIGETYQTVFNDDPIEVVANSLGEAVNILAKEIRKLYIHTSGNVSTLSYTALDGFKQDVQMSKDFRLNKYDNLIIKTFGYNIILKGFKYMEKELTIPDTITAACEDILDTLYSPCTIKCSLNISRAFGDVIRDNRSRYKHIQLARLS